jgi:hypothetical protein
MKMVLFVGLVIIFITTFFTLALGTFLFNETVGCEEGTPDDFNYRVENYNMDMVFTFFMVISFIIVDMGAVYLMVTTWKF